MSKINKLLKRFLSKPKDFTWDELVTLLKHYGYEEFVVGKTGGSRRKFIDNEKNIISFHKPHPSNIVKGYVIKEAIEHLRIKGKLENE